MFVNKLSIKISCIFFVTLVTLSEFAFGMDSELEDDAPTSSGVVHAPQPDTTDSDRLERHFGVTMTVLKIEDKPENEETVAWFQLMYQLNDKNKYIKIGPFDFTASVDDLKEAITYFYRTKEINRINMIGTSGNIDGRETIKDFCANIKTDSVSILFK